MKSLICALALLATGELGASDQQPLYLMGGVNHPTHNESAQLDAYGTYVGAGYVSGQAGLFQSGLAGVDLDWRHTNGHNGTLDSIDFCYAERLFGLAGSFYLGYGLGSSYNILKRSEPASKTEGWRIIGKVMAGYDLGGGLIVEGTYFVSGEVGNVSTNGVSLAAGFWF